MHANHTPGPWTLGDENDPLVFSPVAGAYVAQVLAYEGGSLRSNYAADAALIAAAPELLAALREIEALDDSVIGLNRIEYARTIARAAIAKATGAHGEAGA